MLHRYWIEFSPNGKASPLNLGCGVTAKTKDDAINMVRDFVFPIFGERDFAEIAEDFDIEHLDTGHVLPNIGNPAVLGVWYPVIS